MAVITEKEIVKVFNIEVSYNELNILNDAVGQHTEGGMETYYLYIKLNDAVINEERKRKGNKNESL